jgi:hypothetical protein
MVFNLYAHTKTMTYVPKHRRVQVNQFPQLCPAQVSKPVLDFSILARPEEVVVHAPEPAKLPYGWGKLYFHHHQVVWETEYVHPEPTLDELANKTILKMKARWYKFYRDRDMEPPDYDYYPMEMEDDVTETESSLSAEDPDVYSD